MPASASTRPASPDVTRAGSRVLGRGRRRLGETLVAHETQCIPIGDVLDGAPCLPNPRRSAYNAALQWKRTGDQVVVIGPGTIGLLVTAALRMLHPDLDIAMVSPGEFGSARALEAGATRILPTGAGAVEELAASDGGRVVRPRMTRSADPRAGGSCSLDCVGYPDTIDLSLHSAAARRHAVLVGAAGKQTVDWSLVWSRELTVQGTINRVRSRYWAVGARWNRWPSGSRIPPTASTGW